MRGRWEGQANRRLEQTRAGPWDWYFPWDGQEVHNVIRPRSSIARWAVPSSVLVSTPPSRPTVRSPCPAPFGSSAAHPFRQFVAVAQAVQECHGSLHVTLDQRRRQRATLVAAPVESVYEAIDENEFLCFLPPLFSEISPNTPGSGTLARPGEFRKKPGGRRR